MQPSASTGRTSLAVVIGLAVAVAAALTLSMFSVARAGAVSVLPMTSQQTGIAVCGHGKATSKPDRAQIAVGVHASAPTAEGARAQAAQAMSAVIAALKRNGVADKDIQTSYFAISPDYKYDSSGQHPNGYVATNNVSVTILAVGNTGKIVDAATLAGGNNIVVSGIQFFTGDLTQAQTEAQTNALQDARRQAQTIATAAGVGLGPPVSIQVGACGTSSVPIYAQAQGAVSDKSSPPTPIQPGQQELAVYVAVVYAIR